MKIWIVTAVDTSDSSDGKARVLGAFKTESEARDYVKLDMEDYIGKYVGEGIEFDFGKMSVRFDYGSYDGCEWNVEEVDVK